MFKFANVDVSKFWWDEFQFQHGILLFSIVKEISWLSIAVFVYKNCIFAN